MDLLIVIYLHFLEICQKINLFGHGSNEKVALNLKLFQRIFRVFNGCWYPFRKVIVSQDQGNQLVGKYALRLVSDDKLSDGTSDTVQF